MAMWIPVTLVAGLLSILLFLKQLWSHKNYPPGPLRLPIIGSAWRILIDFSQDTFIKLAKEYGNVYTVWSGSLPVVVMSGFEAVKEAAINHSADFDERPVTPFFEAIGKKSGIIFSNGHIWKQQRKFGLVTMRKLGLGKKGIEQQIHEEAYHLVQAFADAKRQPLDPAIPITNSVTNVICALTFGQRYSLRDEEFLKLRDALKTFVDGTATIYHLLYDLFPWIMKHLPGPHKRSIAARDFVADFAMKEIQRHRVHEAVHEPRDFIDYYLLQMGKSKRDPTSTYNEENLVQCIADLFAAGTETTTTTLYWAFLLMANYPDVQEKVQKEIDNAFGSSEFFSYQDRRKVPYTNAVIHEIQRSRYILLFGVPRQCSKDVNIFGFFIPKGATVITDLRSVLLDPKKWETPEKFNPNHFLDKDGQFVENEAFLPFGAGARVCVGEQLASIEIFIIFTRMLRAFTLQAPEGVKRISEEPIVRLTTPPCPYKICAIPRNNGS
ncbi:PREDICTED: cytochrome P450 2J2-like [Gekko japonicus]|uniref:Cytochrome P450 2J2-like n=1 Tax=Gekko japonicus TaxID=146911 RepID=A0ABM1KE65_GEKJA|nr:PREDICTED: cytochrome P450 2J2-like [Gekko japonicus]